MQTRERGGMVELHSSAGPGRPARNLRCHTRSGKSVALSVVNGKRQLVVAEVGRGRLEGDRRRGQAIDPAEFHVGHAEMRPGGRAVAAVEDEDLMKARDRYMDRLQSDGDMEPAVHALGRRESGPTGNEIGQLQVVGATGVLEHKHEVIDPGRICFDVEVEFDRAKLVQIFVLRIPSEFAIGEAEGVPTVGRAETTSMAFAGKAWCRRGEIGVDRTGFPAGAPQLPLRRNCRQIT